MRVFVTGATGVIGMRAVPLLIDAGHEVSALSRSDANHQRLRQLGATPVEADLFDVPSLRDAFGGHDAVINLATAMPGSARQMMLPWAWKTNDRIRRDGSRAVAAAARAEGVRRLIQESFAPIYVDRGDAWIDESTPVAPASYNRTTLDADQSAERFTAEGGTGVVLRFAGLYGPDALMREMLDVMRKGWSPLPGDPLAYFTSLAQQDAATAVVAALDVPAGTYNVAEDEPVRRGDWVRTLAAAANLPTPRPIPKWIAALGGSLMRLLSRSQRMSNRRFRTASGWHPQYPTAPDAWPEVVRALGRDPAPPDRARRLAPGR